MLKNKEVWMLLCNFVRIPVINFMWLNFVKILLSLTGMDLCYIIIIGIMTRLAKGLPVHIQFMLLNIKNKKQNYKWLNNYCFSSESEGIVYDNDHTYLRRIVNSLLYFACLALKSFFNEKQTLEKYEYFDLSICSFII